jgi:hypothetical protein
VPPKPTAVFGEDKGKQPIRKTTPIEIIVDTYFPVLAADVYNTGNSQKRNVERDNFRFIIQSIIDDELLTKEEIFDLQPVSMSKALFDEFIGRVDTRLKYTLKLSLFNDKKLNRAVREALLKTESESETPKEAKENVS